MSTAAIRRDGTQKAVVDRMQTRADSTDTLGYHADAAGMTPHARQEIHDEHPAPKPKKSVALSGVAGGNTALCTVGRTRQRPALPRLRHPRHRRKPASSRRSPTCWCTASCRHRAELAGYKTKLRRCAACRRRCKAVARAASRGRPSDGRDAHRRRLGCSARVLPREGRPQARRARATSPTA